jgi:hypothetical protein
LKDIHDSLHHLCELTGEGEVTREERENLGGGGEREREDQPLNEGKYLCGLLIGSMDRLTQQRYLRQTLFHLLLSIQVRGHRRPTLT